MLHRLLLALCNTNRRYNSYKTFKISNDMQFYPSSLKSRMVLLLGITGALQTSLTGLLAWIFLTHSLSDQIGEKALKVAQTIAVMPSVITAVTQRDIIFLNELATTLTDTNQALFIVIGDQHGLRLAHPSEQKIGLSMADDDDDDNSEALIDGRGYISKAKGSLGPSMRGKSPVRDSNGRNIVGVISVGYSLDQVDAVIDQYRNVLFVVISLMIASSIVIAVIIASRFKKAIFGLEPEQISQLFEEQTATLESIHEGVIAINHEGIITTLNKKAIETLALDKLSLGQHISKILPDSGMNDIINTGKPQFDIEVWLNGCAMIVNRIPLRIDAKIIGVVSSFRPKNELDRISKKLSQIQTLADSLRSQAHEYPNKLHTISGLIQLGALDEALAVIGSETAVHQALIRQLMDTIEEPLICGCILGKYSRAREMGLSLNVDKESQLGAFSDYLPKEQVVSCLGNLIDNALEATLAHAGSGGEVSVSMTDIGDDFVFEVEDHGGGIKIEERDQLFEKGYSSKSDNNHGLGLYLIKQLIGQWGGNITIDSEFGKGSRFTLYLPKSSRMNSRELL
ncbi:MAG: two-component system CitB family sensor kinase [Pseudohongiellaceae bacterium]|jgi:two-component system CitB family sensor kinase